MLKKSLFCLLICLPVIVNAASEPQQPPSPSCEIPDYDVLVSFDLLSSMPRTSDEPRLTVQGNRKVILGDPYGLSQRIEQQIDQVQVQQLLNFVVEKNHFFDIDVTTIQKQIREERNKTGRLFAMADAAETVIKVCSGKKQKQVKFYALAHAAKQFPEIAALQQLHAIEQELQRIATWLRMGGDEGTQSVLSLVNDHLAKKHPDVKPLTLKNLSTAVVDPDGNLTIYFSRRGFKPSDTGMRNMTVIVYRPTGKNDKSTVTVNLE